MSFDLKLNGGDLQIAKSGDVETVYDNEKLYQDMLKILVSPLGSNKLHFWYGSGINAAVVGNSFSEDITTDSAIQQISSALENLQMMQKNQAMNQNVTNYEKLVAVKNIYVGIAESDPRLVEVSVSVITGGLKNIRVKFFVRL